MNKDEIEKILYTQNLHLATISQRATAFFLDELLLSLLVTVALWSSFENAKTIQELIVLSNSFAMDYIILKIIYQTFFVYQYGATLGKLAMKIKVIEIRTQSNPSFASSLNRAIFRIISEMFFYLGFLWGMMDPLKQTWHDKTAKTLVIKS
jgi:uncharacterized RDD family membrane protein YckC